MPTMSYAHQRCYSKQTCGRLSPHNASHIPNSSYLLPRHLPQGLSPLEGQSAPHSCYIPPPCHQRERLKALQTSLVLYHLFKGDNFKQFIVKLHMYTLAQLSLSLCQHCFTNTAGASTREPPGACGTGFNILNQHWSSKKAHQLDPIQLLGLVGVGKHAICSLSTQTPVEGYLFSIPNADQRHLEMETTGAI